MLRTTHARRDVYVPSGRTPSVKTEWCWIRFFLLLSLPTQRGKYFGVFFRLPTTGGVLKLSIARRTFLLTPGGIINSPRNLPVGPAGSLTVSPSQQVCQPLLVGTSSGEWRVEWWAVSSLLIIWYQYIYEIYHIPPVSLTLLIII